MESGWNVWMWLVGVVSRRRVWLVGVGGIYGLVSRRWMWVESMGVVVRRYIDFLILLISTVLFCSQRPYFLFIFLNVLYKNCVIILLWVICTL